MKENTGVTIAETSRTWARHKQLRGSQYSNCATDHRKVL